MSIELTMPRLSDTMEQGAIIKWEVNEGDKVSAGDVVADIETDKATMEMQVYDNGTIARILVPEGQTVDVGTVIAMIAEEDESLEEVAAAADPSGSVSSTPTPDSPAPESATPPTPPTPPLSMPAEPVSTTQPTAALDAAESKLPNGRVRISPVARRLADDHGIDVNNLEPSGPGGRIVKRDVLRAIETGVETAAAIAPSAQAPPPAAPAQTQPLATVAPAEQQSAPVLAKPGLEDRLVPLSPARQTIARRLVESKTTIPHYQVTMTFDVDPLLGMRKTLNEQLADQGVKLSLNDFLIRACAVAMHEHPQFNASWAEKHIQIHGNVNIGMAIALPSERGGGLVVGSIRNADQRSLRSISLEAKRLAEKARTRGLTIEEMSDTTFTISNLGMFGVEHFTAIINPPNSAILAVGAAVEKPVVRDGELTIGNEMTATLSLDHRVLDGAMGAQYMRTLKQMIENPATLLV